MDICEHCGRLFLAIRCELTLVELEDIYGTWTEWLCSTCVDELAQVVYEEPSTLVRFALYGFELPKPRRAS